MTANTDSITMRLEAYLIQLTAVNQRWVDWLRRQEQSVVSLELESLQALRQEAGQLIAELSEMKSLRSTMLEDAERLGLPARNLQMLARSLPAWKKNSVRAAITSARGQLSNLRRLHVAVWVLIHQMSHFYSGSLQLLTDGATGRPAYVRSGNVDTGGGTLLDQDL